MQSSRLRDPRQKLNEIHNGLHPITQTIYTIKRKDMIHAFHNTICQVSFVPVILWTRLQVFSKYIKYLKGFLKIGIWVFLNFNPKWYANWMCTFRKQKALTNGTFVGNSKCQVFESSVWKNHPLWSTCFVFYTNLPYSYEILRSNYSKCWLDIFTFTYTVTFSVYKNKGNLWTS